MEKNIDLVGMLMNYNNCIYNKSFWDTKAIVECMLDIMLKEGPQNIMISKDIYPVVAKYRRTTTTALERNVRFFIKIGFEDNKDKFVELMHSDKRPTNTNFVYAMAFKIYNMINEN